MANTNCSKTNSGTISSVYGHYKHPANKYVFTSLECCTVNKKEIQKVNLNIGPKTYTIIMPHNKEIYSAMDEFNKIRKEIMSSINHSGNTSELFSTAYGWFNYNANNDAFVSLERIIYNEETVQKVIFNNGDMAHTIYKFVDREECWVNDRFNEVREEIMSALKEHIKNN